MSCEECGGVLPTKPYVWTSWSDTAYIFTDHNFCSGVCRDQWLRRRLMVARCHKCGELISHEEVEFRYCDPERKSLPFHKGCW